MIWTIVIEIISKGPNCVGIFSPRLHLRTETDAVSETSCFYSHKHRMMEEVQEPSNSMQLYFDLRNSFMASHAVNCYLSRTQLRFRYLEMGFMLETVLFCMLIFNVWKFFNILLS
jgi:hypothetical protein